MNIKFIGGAVVSSQDTWDWVSSVDFTSLYPSIQMTLNIGADTFIPNPPQELLDLKEKYFLRYYEEESAEEVQNKNLKFVKEVLFNKEIREEVHSVLDKYNVCSTPNGIFFSKENRSLISEIIEKNLKDRKHQKTLMKEQEKIIETLKKEHKDYSDAKNLRDRYDATQTSLKVLLNSLYGILSMEANPFAGHKDIFSNSVTSFGQVADLSCLVFAGDIINKINQKLDNPLKVKGNKELPWIPQADTDSGYICLEPYVKLIKTPEDDVYSITEKIDNFLKKIMLPKLQDHLMNTLCYFFNAKMPEKMNLDREIISDKFFSIGNKNYYCRIFDNEGVRLTEPKIKTVGIAVKKTNCPKFFRNSVLEAMVLLLDNKDKEIRELTQKYKQEIKKANILDLAISVNINSIDYQYDNQGKLYTIKNGKRLPAPINSRAAIVYNSFIKKYNIPLKEIETGKANYIFLKEPNITKSNVIAFKDPKIFEYKDLKNYIDYDLLFEKYYLGLLELITKPLKLDPFKENKIDLDEW